MKRSFYLFNPGIMERRDNTLKFTPVVENEDNTEIKQQPRYIPIEDVAELYAFGSLRANSALFNFLGQKGLEPCNRHNSIQRLVSFTLPVNDAIRCALTYLRYSSPLS